MKCFLAIAVGILTIAGCGDGNRTEDTGGMDTSGGVRSDSGGEQGGMHGSDGGRHGGSMTGDTGMMSGNMERDMAMMNEMMVEALGPADSAYDIRFINMMIPHHEGAIAMAKDAATKATRKELREMARATVESQQKEIDRMRGLRLRWSGSSGAGGSDSMTSNMNTMNQMMVQQLGNGDADYEHRFIDMMIPHHQGALLMARDALGKAQHPELKELAEGIIREQEREIEQMNKWREEWYGH